MDLYRILIYVPIALITLSVHEYAHGYVSDKLGDPTPRSSGRLTLNPLAHIDIVGVLLMIFTGFGWAKPVPVNPRYYRDPKKGMALVAFAGPLSNLIMALIGVLLMYVSLIIGVKVGAVSAMGWINSVLRIFVVRNLCLAVFNLIPIPPLDGSRVLGLILPSRTYFSIMRYEQYSMLVLLVLSVTGAFDVIIGSGVNGLMSLMISLFEPLLNLLG